MSTASSSTALRPGRLCLADGTTFAGYLVGGDQAGVGEAVFTTGMTGYQEVLTDPSYAGQIVTLTAPEIGNTGINEDDHESVDSRPRVAGLVVRHLSSRTSNWRATSSLTEFLQKHRVPAIAEIDTRALTRHIRDRGAQNAAIGDEPVDVLVERARAAPAMEGRNLVAEVTPRESYRYGDPKAGPHIVMLDLGVKKNILRCLAESGCHVTAMPANTPAREVLGASPDGIFLSNGPGDPAAVETTIDTIRALLGTKPIFGICLGHQLLARAIGAKTFKLKFGHHGLNQPVRDLESGRIEITSQNHGFAVDVQSLPPQAKSTHVHLNDGTSEGLRLASAGAFSVQYHPEAAAGPHDTMHLFRRFVRMVEQHQS